MVWRNAGGIYERKTLFQIKKKPDQGHANGALRDSDDGMEIFAGILKRGPDDGHAELELNILSPWADKNTGVAGSARGKPKPIISHSRNLDETRRPTVLGRPRKWVFFFLCFMHYYDSDRLNSGPVCLSERRNLDDLEECWKNL